MKSCLSEYLDKSMFWSPPTPVLAPKTCRRWGDDLKDPEVLSDEAIDNICEFMADPGTAHTKSWIRRSLENRNQRIHEAAFKRATKALNIS